MNDSAPSKPQPGAWSPLRRGLFLAFWLANLASLIGTWIHEVGAAWLMTSLSPSPLLVALVQAATSLPVFFLALPAGALADVIDRRRLLLGAQLWMLLTALSLGLLTLGGLTNAPALLALTFLLGIGAALNAPVWQAVLPELVPEDELPAAVALGSVGFNVARAVGPALGGLLVAAAGPGLAFVVNATTFIAVLGVVFSWRRAAKQEPLPPEPVVAALVGGLRFVRNADDLRAVLVRVGAFMICGSALWSLLPVVAKIELEVDAFHYGVLLGCLGAGAVAGAFFLARIREATSTDALVAAATLGLAAVVGGVSQVRAFGWLCALLLVGGVAWLALLSSFNTSVQILVPAWVRGRAVSIYLLVFAGGSTLGSAIWGGLAAGTSTRTSLAISAGCLAGTLVLALRYRLPRARPEGLAPSLHWPTPVAQEDVVAAGGPVQIQIEYRVERDDWSAFLERIEALRPARLRSGGWGWELYQDPESPERFLEVFHTNSWVAHLRQHARSSESDAELQARVRELHAGAGDPRVTHWVGARRGIVA